MKDYDNNFRGSKSSILFNTAEKKMPIHMIHMTMTIYADYNHLRAGTGINLHEDAHSETIF